MNIVSNCYTQPFARFCEHTNKKQCIEVTLGKQQVVGAESQRYTVVGANCPDAATCGHAEDCPVVKKAQGVWG